MHLSDLTRNETYGQLAEKGESYLLNPKPASSEPWPGLIGTNVDINTGLFQDAEGGWIAGADSFYEYLIKMYVYDSNRFGHYKGKDVSVAFLGCIGSNGSTDRWVLAADSSIEHLASHPSTRPDLTFLAYFKGQNKTLESQHRRIFSLTP